MIKKILSKLFAFKTNEEKARLKKAKKDFYKNEDKCIALEEKWIRTLSKTRGNEHFNEDYETFALYDSNVEEIGMSGKVRIPLGLSFDTYLNLNPIIESGIKGLVFPKYNRFGGYIDVTIVDRKPDFKFVPHKCKPEEIMVGYNTFGLPIFLDLTKKTPHLLIGGASGTGKSFIMYMVLTNLIYSYDKDKNDFRIIFLQVMKEELGAFKNCIPARELGLHTDIADIRNQLVMLNDLVFRRGTELKESNVKEYNKILSKGGKKERFRPIYIFIDELAFFMPLSSEKGAIADIKKQCIELLCNISKAGRSTGVHMIALVQRATTKNIDGNMKSNFARLTAMQNSVIDSQCIIDSNAATKLLDREVIFRSGGDMQNLYIPTMNDDLSDLKKAVPEITISKDRVKKGIDEAVLRDFDIRFNSLAGAKYENKDRDKAYDIEPLVVAMGNPDIEAKFDNGNTLVLNKKEDSIKEPLSNTDKLLLNALDEYKVITTSMAKAIKKGNLSTNKNPAGERLKVLEERGYLKSYNLKELYLFHHNNNEKIYFNPLENRSKGHMYHTYLSSSLYGILYKDGYEINSYKIEQRVFYDSSNYIIPDASIVITRPKDKKKINIYYEADYQHPTTEEKIRKYEMLNDSNFILVIATSHKTKSGSDTLDKIPTSDKLIILHENFKTSLTLLDFLKKI